jgi:hypothetical protein
LDDGGWLLRVTSQTAKCSAWSARNGWLVERWCARFPTHLPAFPFTTALSDFALQSEMSHVRWGHAYCARLCDWSTVVPLPTVHGVQHRALTTGAAAAISSRDHTARRLCPLLHCATGVVVSVRPGVHHASLWPAVARALSVSSSPSPANGSATSTASGKKSGKPGGAKGDSSTTSTNDNGGVGTARPPVASRVVGPKAVVAPATVTSTLLATARRAGDAAAAAKVTSSGGSSGVRGNRPHTSKGPVAPGKSGSGGGGVAGVAAAPAASKKKPGRYTQLSRGLSLTFVHWRPHLSPSLAPSSYHIGAALTEQAPSTFRAQPL